MRFEQVQLEVLKDFLLSVPGIIALLLFFLLVLCQFLAPQLKWMFLTGLLFFCTLSFSATAYQTYQLLIPGLEQSRKYGRSLSAACLVAMVLPAILAPRGRRTRLTSGAVLLWIGFLCLFAMFHIFGGNAERGLVALMAFALAFITLTLGLGKWMQTHRDAATAIRCIGISALVFVFFCTAQLLINRSAVMSGKRFQGLTGNPQGAGLTLAAAIPPLAYLVARRGEGFFRRIIYAGTLALAFVLLLWTGSRTGGLMAVVGIVTLYRRRLHHFVIVGSIVTAMAFAGTQVFQESTKNMERFTAPTNTRAEAWRGLLREFQSSPMVGTLATGVSSVDIPMQYTENSYLVVAARMGVVGVIPLLAVMFAVGRDLFRLSRQRRFLGPDAFMSDLVLAGLISFAVGAMFEGFLVGIFTHQLYCIMIYLAVMNCLLDPATAENAGLLPALAADGGYAPEWDHGSDADVDPELRAAAAAMGAPARAYAAHPNPSHASYDSFDQAGH